MSNWNIVQRKVMILSLNLNPTPETWTITWKFYEKHQEALIYIFLPSKKNLAQSKGVFLMCLMHDYTGGNFFAWLWEEADL